HRRRLSIAELVAEILLRNSCCGTLVAELLARPVDIASIAIKSILRRSSIRSKVSGASKTRRPAASLTARGDVIGKGRAHGVRSCRRRGRIPVEPARRTERATLRTRRRAGIHAPLPRLCAVCQGAAAGIAALHCTL